MKSPLRSRFEALGMALHKALDYFFCDRCILETGRFPDWLEEIISELCPISWLFAYLPDEEEREVKPLFPRSALKRPEENG